ncbi:MAG: hypothetical protein JO072_03095 [Parafilimonas sp.]|nr:hypothetical protein [Parafilimonas sp.]
MKIGKFSLTTTLLVLLFINCSKENNPAKLKSSSAGNSVVSQSDITLIPLNDLGKNTYKDSVGGLYPGGKNSPSGTYANDLLKTSNSIAPIDSFGNPHKHGRIVFISLGGSTGGHNMTQLKKQTKNNPLTNSNLVLLDCNNGYGDASLNSIMNPNDSYWDHVTQIIQGAYSSYRQVQIIYLETDDSSMQKYWPNRPNLVKNELESCLRVFKQKFPNIKMVYVLGRTRTFGNEELWNREPSPYYFGWACKWAIQDQINGVPGTQYKGKKAVAPMITWGWYQWADTTPRKTDGFYWLQSETSDGLHATPEGQDTLATRFQNFLLTDKFAKIWYAAQPTGFSK